MTETELRERLEKLERDNRRLKRYALAALIVLAGLGGIYATEGGSDIVAHRLILLDDAGKISAMIVGYSVPPSATKGLPPSKGSAGMRFYDASEYVGGVLSFDPDGETSLSILSNPIGGDVNLRASPDGSASVNVATPPLVTGASSGQIAVGADGEASVFLARTPGILQVGDIGEVLAKVGGDRRPVVRLGDSQGFLMDLGSTGTVNDKTGESQKTSAASITMFGNDKDHHATWHAP